MKQPNDSEFFSEMNVVPYIDVMLVLLIIFMISAPLLQQGIEVSLPKEDAKVVQSQDHIPLVVSINHKGEYFLNVMENPESPTTERALLIRIAAEIKRNPARSVYVKGDKNASYAQVAHAMAILQKAGTQKIGLVTEGL